MTTTSTPKPPTDRKKAAIIASLRDQRLDVHIGIITAAEWNRRYDLAVTQVGDIPLDRMSA